MNTNEAIETLKDQGKKELSNEIREAIGELEDKFYKNKLTVNDRMIWDYLSIKIFNLLK